MQNILILASGEIAKHFIQWVSKSRIDENYYTITYTRHEELLLKITPHLTFIDEDPTSLLKLTELMENTVFSSAFIVMDSRNEAICSYKNIRKLYPRLRIVFVSQWCDLTLDDENVNMMDTHELMASYLYEQLPNVPVIAKNIGFGQGDIMEILVPLGSPYAYRHMGSIVHRKWRVAAIYRNKKQILPNNATMIQPNDILIVIGNPRVLEEVYRVIRKSRGIFPDPFGKNLYLILDMCREREEIMIEVNEAIFLSKQLNRKLYIRLINITLSGVSQELKALENEKLEILINYHYDELFNTMDFDTTHYDIGLFLINNELFDKESFKYRLYKLRRAVYLFGENSLYNISEATILMGDEGAMESVSSSVFDLVEILGLKLNLCNYSPDGDFAEKKNIIEHYESLSRLYSFSVDIKENRTNPIKELQSDDGILHIAPFNKEILKTPLANFFSRKISRYFLSIRKHPQLLIPIEE